MKYVWGVKILLQTSHYTDAAIGLYDTEFRWIETATSGLTESWADGLIKADSIDSIKVGWNSEYGGGISIIGNSAVTINNCKQLIHTINDYPIYLLGKQAVIWEFILTDAGVLQSSGIKYSGICEAPKWTETDLKIPIREATFKRRTNIGTTISNIEIPVTFGDWREGAKIVKVKDVRTTISNTDIVNYLTPANQKYFACHDVGDNSGYPILYRSYISNNTLTYDRYLDSTLDWTAVYDTYLEVVSGDLKGQFNEISHWRFQPNSTLDVRVKNLFDNNSDGTMSIGGQLNSSWFKLFIRDSTYQIDTWPCGGFQDPDGNLLTDKASLSVFDSSYVRLPDGGLTVDTDNTNNNTLKVISTRFVGSIDTLDTWLTVPMTFTPYIGTWGGPGNNVPFETDWGLTDIVGSHHYSYAYPGQDVPGLYTGTQVSDNPVASGAALYSNDATYTYVLPRPGYLTPIRYTLAFEATPPPFPENFEFDSMHLFLNVKVEWSTVGHDTTIGADDQPIYLMYRRFRYPGVAPGGTYDPILTAKKQGLNNTNSVLIADIPDTGFSGNYVLSKSGLDGTTWKYTGYKQFELTDITTKEEYESIYKIGLIISRSAWAPNLNITDNVYLCETNIAFKKSIDISDEMYTGMQGRTYAESWRAGIDATAVMTRPAAIMEHLCRLQNWSETGETMPAKGWGHAYATSAKINDSTNYGGFEENSIETNLDYPIARQIIGEAWTDDLLQGLCQENFCVLTQQHNNSDSTTAGRNNLYYLYNDTTSTLSLTLADVVGNISEIKEQESKDVFCEPFVDYNFDVGSGEFKSRLAINNASAAEYSADYVQGFELQEGEYYWTRCHLLWQKYGVVEKAPENLTSLRWVRDIDTAKTYLDRWLRWMGSLNDSTLSPINHLSLSVPYVTGKDSFVGQKVDLTLPHQTDGTTWVCMLDNVEINRDKVNLGLLLLHPLGDTMSDDFMIQDVYVDGITETWEDKYTGADLISDDRM